MEGVGDKNWKGRARQEKKKKLSRALQLEKHDKWAAQF